MFKPDNVVRRKQGARPDMYWAPPMHTAPLQGPQEALTMGRKLKWKRHCTQLQNMTEAWDKYFPGTISIKKA